jgi:cytoskeletal protein RodZ
MGLFNRNKQTTIAELEEYYASQNSSRRTAKAWFMALLSLLITIAVIVGLFMGGRWLYRTLTDSANDTTTTQTDSETSSGADVALPSFDGSLPARPSTPPVEGNGVANGNTPEPNGVVSDQAANTSTPSQNTAGASTSRTLPNTGASETIAIVIVASFIIGYSIARKHLALK